MVKVLSSFALVLLSFSFIAQDHYYNFIENKGQWPDGVFYKAELESGDFYLQNGSFLFNFWDLNEIRNLHTNPDFDKIIAESPPVVKGHAYKVKFMGNTFYDVPQTNFQTPTKTNYYLGDDPSKWAGGCNSFGEVTYSNLYYGIDLKVYSQDFFLKYDFIVKSGIDPKRILMEYEGAENVKLVNGRIEIQLSMNTVIEQKPIAYQIIDGERKFVPCEFKLKNNQVSFKFPKGYDKKHELIIDPILSFSTYSGSTADNFGYTATYDSEGYLYSGSSVFGAGYPYILGSYEDTWAGGTGSGTLIGTDIGISKYDVSGTFMVYSTYLGGESDELPHSLIVDQNDQLFVYGTTSSPDYPTTSGAYNDTFQGGTSFAPGGVGVDYENGSDIIVTRFNSDGSDLLASTFVGGTGNDGVNTENGLKFNYADDMRGEILIDSNGDILVASCTYSDDFPTENGFQTTLAGNQDGCLFKMTNNLETMIWSTYLGGEDGDAAYSLDLDSNNDIYVCGGTQSDLFWATFGAFQISNSGGDADGFILKMLGDGSDITACTYYGTDSYDQLYFVEVDDNDDVYVYGQTRTITDYFINNAIYNHPGSGMVVAKFTPDLENRYWSTVFGTGSGKPNLSPTAFLVDDCQRIYMSGWGGATNVSSTGGDADYVTGMDTTEDAYQETTDGSDFYLLVLDNTVSSILYGSFFGGSISNEHVDGGTSRFSPDGTVYQSVCAGCGSNDDFPIYPADAVSATNNSSNCNNGVFKMKFDIPTVSALFDAPDQYCINEPVQFINLSQGGSSYSWDFGDSSPTSDEFQPQHIYTETGVYTVTLTAFNSVCGVSDTYSQDIEIIESESYSFEPAQACNGMEVVLGPDLVFSDWVYDWFPNDFFTDLNNPNPSVILEDDEDFTLLIEHDACVDTVFQTVELIDLSLIVPDDLIICDEDDIQGIATAPIDADIIWSTLPDFSIVINDNVDDFDFEYYVDEETTFYAQASIGDCIEYGEFTVSVLSQQVQLEADYVVCAGDTVSISVVDPIAGLTYTWSPNNEVISGQGSPTITAYIDEVTVFTVTAQINSDCIVSDQITIGLSGLSIDQISVTADPDIILTGGSSQLQANPDNLNYVWSPPETLDNPTLDDPLATPLTTTWYVANIADGDCIYKDSVLVQVYDYICGNPMVFVPNAFSPNSNSANEILYVRGTNLTYVQLLIFDRWGEKVFETTDQATGWDGTFKGEALDPAVFVYHLNVICGDGQAYFEKGNITIVR